MSMIDVWILWMLVTAFVCAWVAAWGLLGAWRAMRGER